MPHDDEMAALLCQLLGKDPAKFGKAGWIVLLVTADETQLDVSVSTDAPSTEVLAQALTRVLSEIGP